MSFLAFILAALASPPEDDALPLTLAGDVRTVDEAETAYWMAALNPPLQQKRGTTAPFIDFSRLELTPAIGVAQYSTDFEAGVGFMGSVQLRVPVPGLPGKRWGILAEAFYASIDREDLPFFYTETAGSAAGFGLGADFEFYYSENFHFRVQAGYLQVIFQDAVDLEDGGSLMGGIVLGVTMNKARSATISFCYNPQMLYDSEDWILLHQLGLQIQF